MSFLGIHIDTTSCRLSIPEEKLSFYHRQVRHSLADEVEGGLTVKTLESILGKLNWYCEVLIAGRARLRRIRQCIPGGGRYHPSPSTHVSLSSAAREDLKWWEQQLLLASQQPRYVPFWTEQPPIYCNIFSDAAGDVGFGLVLGDKVYQGLWREETLKESSCFKELIPILLALEMLPTEADGQVVIVNTDNLSNVYAINKGTCASEDLYPLLFAITELAAQRNIYLLANWIPREKMEFCDGISRYPWFILGSSR
jgi:hypothetical protein